MKTLEHEFTAEGQLLTDRDGMLKPAVLSTPAMIMMMEHASALLLEPEMDEGQTTVGFAVCVKHVAGAFDGAACVARAALREVVDGRKFHFDVEVLEGERTIGVGTHERRAITPS